MNNAEKYKEVFGIVPDPELCPAKNCEECPVGLASDGMCAASPLTFWNSEWKHSTQININQQK